MKITCLNCSWLQPCILLLLGACWTPFGLQAQALFTQTIKGVVIDQESEQPIIGANVILLDSEPFLGAASDMEGAFRLDRVPLGRHNLQVSCLGYEEAFVYELEVGAGKEVILKIRLAESLVLMDEVVVKAERLNGTPNNEMASVSARSFSVEQTKRYAAAVNDPARMAMSFAGVSSTDDGENQIVIRGNSPRGVLWRMEGIEIPNPNHFAQNGASGGAISALSVNVLANSDFLTGAFPAEYGNAYSGVFDLKMRAGNNEQREYAFQAGVLGLDFAAEGPIGEKGGASYLTNYRFSTLAILNELGLFPSDASATTFQDAAFKVHLPTAKNGYVSIWGLGGLSKDVFQVEGETYAYDYYSDRGVLGVNYRHYLNDRTYLETIVSFSADRQGEDYTDSEDDILFRENYTNRALRASVLLNQKLSARHTLRFGAVGQQLQYRLYEALEEEGDETIGVNEKGNTQFLQAYGQWKYRIRTNLQANVGLHASYLALGGQYAIEPRIGMRWNFRTGQVLSFGAGMHSRMDPLPVYFARVEEGDEFTQPNTELALSKSAHLVLGYEWRFRPGWRWQSELYYQHLYNIPIGTPTTQEPFLRSESWLNADAGFVNDTLVSEGTGRNYGLEMTVERFFTGGWYALSTTSLYRSQYTPRDGIERSSRFDGRFVQNLLVGKEWTVGKRKTNQIGFNVRLIYAGGNRYTPIDLPRSAEEGSTYRDWSRSYAEQLPNYFRTDIRLSYRKNRKKTTSTISLDLQNASNRQNTWNYYYDSDDNEVKPIYQLGLIPILNYRLEF